MESEAVGDWVILRRFDQSEIAHDVTTALLAMDYEASLLALSDGTVVAGIGSRVEAEHDDDDKPVEHGGGPWELLVPGESSDELAEVLDTLIEELLEFEQALAHRRRRQRLATRAAMLLGFILITLYVLLSLLGIA